MDSHSKHKTFTISDGSEDDDYELQTDEKCSLINDQELNTDGVDLFNTNPYSMRHRQSALKKTPIRNNLGFELRDLHKNQRPFDTSHDIAEHTYYDILPGDTLQSICLRYACSVNQVKRMNNIMSNQEFYGLRQLKLPVGKLGLLKDVLNTENNFSSMNGELDAGSVPPPPLHPLATSRMNSPGSALSVRSPVHKPQFKPLINLGGSSDRMNHLDTYPDVVADTSTLASPPNVFQPSHSHSFSSLRDLSSNGTYPSHDPTHQNHNYNLSLLKQKSFIKPDLNYNCELGQPIIDLPPNSVDKVFEDLDLHVERAKVAMESYDKRANDLVERIAIDENPSNSTFGLARSRVSKIPELFFCNENFGLNYKKLLVFIFIVCLVVPLIYINQSNIVSN